MTLSLSSTMENTKSSETFHLIIPKLESFELFSWGKERTAEINLLQGEEINALHSLFCLESEYLLALASLVITVTGNILKT